MPNYGYVGRTAKALRQSPFGNFIAFPLEILRTGNNILTGSIDDITAGIGKGTITIQKYQIFKFRFKKIN